MTRKVAIIVALIAIASLSMAGCTTTTTTSPSPTASDTATKLNDAFANQGIAIPSRFTQTTNQYSNAVYTGMVKENNTGATPSVHNITIEEMKNRTDCDARFAAYVAQAKKAGYTPVTNTQGEWWGIIGQGGNISKSATMRINEPNDTISLYGMNIDVQLANYTVSVDYTTWQ